MRSGGMHLPDQKFARLGRGHAVPAGCGESNGVACADVADVFERCRAIGEVDMPEGRVGDLHGLARPEARNVESGITISDPDR